MEENKEEKRFEVLLEAIQSDFKAFGESLELLSRKVGEGFGVINKKFDRVDEKLIRIEAKIDNKADQEKLDSLRNKVIELETLVKK